MQGWLSSRYRLILVVAMLLLIGFGGTSLVYFQTSRNAIRTSILENELPLSSNNVYSEFQKDLLRPVFVSSLMAADTFLRDWVLEGEREPEKMIRYLAEIKNRYQATTSYFISDRSLNYYHFSGISRQIDLKDPNDHWFVEAKTASEPYQINLDENMEENRRLTVFINYRVLDYQGNFLGVTGVGLALDSVSRLIQEYQRNFRRNIYFIDKQGMVRLHSNHDLANQVNLRETPGISDLLEKILAADHGSFTYQRGGETILLTTRHIPELGWYLLIELDESRAIAPIQRGLVVNLGLGLLVILCTILIITITINAFHKRLEAMATTDSLTGLNNRPVFDHVSGKYLAMAQREQRPLALILFDIDLFKEVNDHFGHGMGDAVIQSVAGIAKVELRESDLICRWGGDEFAILLPRCTLEDAVLRAEKIRQRVAASGSLHLEELRVSVSMGATLATRTDSIQSLFARADQALYLAKDQGRNRVVTLTGNDPG